jgi:H+-translocating NAD(P) transhydrogenase subunit alpha
MHMRIAIAKEILPGEKRVAALPENIRKYVSMGFDVDVEAGAGAGVHLADSDYEKAGARIVANPEELFARADLMLKVKQPYFNEQVGKHEAEMLRQGSMLVTFLHPAAPSNHRMVQVLRDRRITALTMDGIPRTSRAQKMDALTSMSTITGYKSVLIAAVHFAKMIPMIGTAIGTIRPATFLIVGAGVVGLQAIATAKRLGGVIKAVDTRKDARDGAGSLGAKVVGFEVPAELAAGEGGYAKALPADWLEQERTALKPAVAEADIIVLSALIPGEVAPVLITEEMVRSMKPGSVIVDVSIDQGGNCALTEAGREVVKHDVLICGTANIPGSVAVHASWLYAHNMAHYIENLFKQGPGTPDWNDEIVQHTLVTRDGKIVHAGALKAMGAVGA